MCAVVDEQQLDCTAYDGVMDALRTERLVTMDHGTCMDDDNCHAAVSTSRSLS